MQRRRRCYLDLHATKSAYKIPMPPSGFEILSSPPVILVFICMANVLVEHLSVPTAIASQIACIEGMKERCKCFTPP